MNEPCWVNNHAHVLVAKENVNVKYLCYYLNYADLSKHITGTTRGKLTKSALEKIEVKIPDYSTQNKIVNALDKSQELIDKRKAQIEALDQLTQSVFLEMFGDPVSNPKGWDVKKLKDIAEIEDGDRGENYPKQHELVSEGILFLSTSNFVNNKLDLSKVTYITKEKFSQLRKGKLRRGDLIVTLRGSIGNIVIFDEEGYDTGFINAQMAILRLKNVNRIFFQQLYTSNSFQLVLKKTQTGSSQPQLPLKNLKELEIIIPPLELQELFAATIQQINLKKELLLKSQAEIQNMFNSLMQRAFKGELFND
ncbi:Type I restriction-modification system specificity subunit S [Geobacillus stearothermophilus]|nr:restriction endonuclease subunit S [Geobacillus stearothermophilus]KAF6509510.1 Type I restriction-modification system specificity subunit S [Geobacillus stearothermophilus]